MLTATTGSATARPDGVGKLRLAELACARVCHDVGGLLGTLAGALEMLGEEIGPSETAELATDAAREMSQRLRLLRAAWGGGCDDADQSRLAELAVGLPGSRRVRADLAGLGDAVLPGPVARVALCMLLAGAEALPGGGTVRLSGGPRRLLAALEGPRKAWSPALQDWASGTAAVPDSPRDLAAPMLALAAEAAAMRLAAPSGNDAPLAAEAS